MCVEKPLNQNQSNRIGALGAVILPPPRHGECSLPDWFEISSCYLLLSRLDVLYKEITRLISDKMPS